MSLVNELWLPGKRPTHSRKSWKRTPGEEGDRIAPTFMNEFKDDLEKSLVARMGCGTIDLITRHEVLEWPLWLNQHREFAS
jgi:hypothetical protein